MNSRVPWSVEGIDQSVRERAEAAARRAGMSFSEWISSNLGDPPSNVRGAMPPKEDVADIHQRLDSITRQIEQISAASPRGDGSRDQGVARQLNDAISRLDARLSQISNPQSGRQGYERQQRQADAVERAAGQLHPSHAYGNGAYNNQENANQGPAARGSAPSSQPFRASPPLSPVSLDVAVAEIAARQSELEQPSPRPQQRPPSAIPPSPPAPDFSSLERYLSKITSQIEALQRPDHLEQSIGAFRNELAEIRAAITEAMPQRAIESLEGEIRSLARRIDDNRQNATDEIALASIERALAEIREVLRSLMPAEQLRGYEEAIRNLGAKLDTILRVSDDPSTVQQLQSAIVALRAMVSNVASNDALSRLSDDVQVLSSKVDQLVRTGSNAEFAALEQRIAALTSALAGREYPAVPDRSEHIESALLALSDRLDRLQVGSDGVSAIAHLEQRVSSLLERLDAAGDHSRSNLGRVEEGLQDILHHLERQHAAFANFAADTSRNASSRQQDPELFDIVKRELSDIRYSQSETNRHTQDSLEAVHSTLGHVVDRLAMIEGDLRAVRSTPVQAAMPTLPHPAERSADIGRFAMPAQPKPELPNPAAAQVPFSAAARDFHAAEAAASAQTTPYNAPPPRAISEILLPHTAAAQPPPLEPELPPDHPLEPGTRPNVRVASPSERVAASESAISDIAAAPPRAPVSSASFIAAARRAAQAAAAQPLGDGGDSKGTGTDKSAKEPSTITSKLRSVLVGASAVVIVLGTFKMALSLIDGGSNLPPPASQHSDDSSARQAQGAAELPAKPVVPDQVTPSMTSPTPVGRQSLNGNAPVPAQVKVDIPPADTISAPAPAASSESTGTISPATGRKGAMVPVPPGDGLPDAIGGPVLRAAASKGDPAAAYEIATRFAEGKVVAQNFDEAAKWYERAAQAGNIPAVFRLGTFYEKGLGVNKDLEIARRYYQKAAERGNAKAMHNLAVLDADGGGKGANYASAAQWFRKAADRGVADSQFNLGILYARGIGVEQNLAESFKWFSLAAAQGDGDAALKRDDIANRLDAQSLAAARLAVQTFAAEPQPDDAVNVAPPAGGWDSATPQAPAKPVARPAITKRASR